MERKDSKRRCWSSQLLSVAGTRSSQNLGDQSKPGPIGLINQLISGKETIKASSYLASLLAAAVRDMDPHVFSRDVPTTTCKLPAPRPS